MSDSPDSTPEGDQHLARPNSGQPGSLLRLRDVQALNRSFRRLAEIQEALLDRIEELEEEKTQSSRWAAPMWTIGGTALGIGLAAVAFVWWQKNQPAADSTLPEIVVQQPEVTVQAPPPDPAMAQAMEQMNANLSGILEQQQQYRGQLGELTDKLLDSEEEKMRIMQEFAKTSRLQDERLQKALADAATANAAPPIELQTPQGNAGPKPQRDPWVGVLNGLLATDGYSSIRIQKATRVANQAALKDVTWMTWDNQGLVSSVIQAGRVEFTLHNMTNTLVLSFRDGTQTVNGARSALPASGLRLELAGINKPAWTEHFPELDQAASLASNEPPEPGAATPVGDFAPVGTGTTLDANGVRRALDELISQRGTYSYYRIKSLGSIDGTTLRLVQINWHDNSGRLVKTIEADVLEIRLHSSGSVELQLRNGAFLDSGVRSPFSSDRFSLYLPRQDLKEWRASGVPYLDVEKS